MEGLTQNVAVSANLPPEGIGLSGRTLNTPVDQRPYLMSESVYLAFLADCTVMLHRGVYHMFGPAETRALALGVQGWPRPSADSAPCRRQSEFLERLAARRVLTKDSSCGRSATAVSIETPTRSLLDHDLDWDRPAITGAHLGRFLLALLKCRVRQTQRPLESLAQWVTVRRAQAGSASDNHADMHRLVHIFRRLRPLISSTRDRCVPDALGLIEFLALSGADISGVRWVVGVRARPWGAHCWVQQNEVVVNDTCERVMQYAPILIA